MAQSMTHSVESSTLADVLERILDKGIVIAGDIKIKLCDIELLTIQIRLMIASVDKAREMGMDWWLRNPDFSSAAASQQAGPASQKAVLAGPQGNGDQESLMSKVEALQKTVAELERTSRKPRSRSGAR
mgnify:CR=1 FL=1